MHKHKGARRAKLVLVFALTALAVLLVAFIAVNTGGLDASFSQICRGLFVEYDKTVAIIFDLRFPRIAVALLGGALMAVSGLLMQVVMRNPLADPGIIGVNAGAAFAAILVTAFLPQLSPFLPIFSFAGGMVAFALVYALAWDGSLTPVRLILVGVAVNAIFTGLYEAFNALTGGSYSGAASIVNANISLKTWQDVRVLALYTLAGAVLCMLAANRCNLMALSDKTIHGLGVNVMASRLGFSVLSVMLASIFTAVIGPVSFLGLVVPHIGRLLVGSDHRLLMPYSALLGALVFLSADTLGRTLVYPYEISASIIMSVIGGIAFVILLKKNRGAYGE